MHLSFLPDPSEIANKKRLGALAAPERSTWSVSHQPEAHVRTIRLSSLSMGYFCDAMVRNGAVHADPVEVQIHPKGCWQPRPPESHGV
jgi:hypothetical protein